MTSLGQYAVLTAFLEKDDEVIMFEPFFDQYLPSITFNGGKPVYVPLHPDADKAHPSGKDWHIDFDELKLVNSIILVVLHNAVPQTRHNAKGKDHYRQHATQSGRKSFH